MKYKSFLTIIIFTILCCSGCTKNGNPLIPKFFPDIEWQKTFGSNNYNRNYVIRATNDGCFVCGGYRQFYLNNGYASLTKINSNGDIIWERIISVYGSQSIYDLQETSDKGFILCGSAKNTSDNKYNIWFARTDASGNLIWSKVIPNYGNSFAWKVQITSEGNFVIGGESSYINGQIHGIILKVRSNGSLIWLYDVCDYGYNAGEVTSVQPLNDGGMLVIGNQSFSTNGYMGIYIVKVNSEGLYEWGKIMVNDTTGLVSRSAIKTNNGKYVIVGYNQSYSPGNRTFQCVILKLDSLGTMFFRQTITDTLVSILYDVYPTSDNGFVFAGIKQRILNLETNGWIIKTDSIFNVEWSRTIGGEKNDSFLSIVANRDGSIISTGSTGSNNSNKSDAWVVKIGMSRCNLPIVRTK